MRRLWKWLCNLLVEIVGVEDEPTWSGHSQYVVTYRGYAASLTGDKSNAEWPTYGAYAYNAEQAMVMTDGGPSEGPPSLTVDGFESPGQAFEAIRMEIDAAWSRVAER